MNKVSEMSKGNRKAEIFENDNSLKYEVMNSIGDNLSRAYEPRSYVNYKAAIRYANKFLNKA